MRIPRFGPTWDSPPTSWTGTGQVEDPWTSRLAFTLTLHSCGCMYSCICTFMCFPCAFHTCPHCPEPLLYVPSERQIKKKKKKLFFICLSCISRNSKNDFFSWKLNIRVYFAPTNAYVCVKLSPQNGMYKQIYRVSYLGMKFSAREWTTLLILMCKISCPGPVFKTLLELRPS
jgi:hypothetical protein